MYIGSVVISFCSLLFGVADSITFNKFGDDLTKVVWCMLSLFVDCLFRALFFSFLSASWVFPEKAGLFAMGLTYVLIIAFYIERKDFNKINYEATLKGALASLVASAWQDKTLEVCKDYSHQELRFASKMTFNCLAAITLTVRSILKEFNHEKTWTDLKDSLNCQNICPDELEKNEIDECLDRSLSLPYQVTVYILGP